MLDALPPCGWLLGLDLETAALAVATIGALQPAAWLPTCYLCRTNLLLISWALAAAWSALSIALFYGIVNVMETLYLVWLWYTLAQLPVMLALMVVMLLPRNDLDCYHERGQSWRRIVFAVFAIIFYLFTFYLVFVVNTHRIKQFPPPR